MEAKRVLIVDDDESIARLFKMILQGKGYLVDTAGTGKEAIEKVSNESFDVALIDLILPDINGLELLPKIHSHTRKIVMTGSATEENERKSLINGADALLPKPVKTETLLKVVADGLINF